MNTLYVRTSGQTVDLSIIDDSGSLSTRASVNGVPIAFPYILVADTAITFSGEGQYTISCLIDGEECYGRTLGFFNNSEAIIEPAATAIQIAGYEQAAPISVRAFGAVGDGVHDDTAAIKQALTEFKSGGLSGRVYFPRGTYLVSQQIDLIGCNGLTLVGDGWDSSQFTSSVSLNSCFYSSGALAGITFLDLGWTGGASYPASVPARNRTFTTSFSHAVEFDGSLVPTESNAVIANVTFKRCRVTSTSSLPVFFRGISGYTRVLDSFFDNCMDVGLIYCASAIVARCRALNGQDNGFSLSRGNTKVVVVDNKVEGCAYHGIWVAGFVIDAGGGVPGPGSDKGPQDFVVVGNLVTNVGRSGIALTDAPKYGVVSGNTVDGVSRGDLNGPSDSYGHGIYVSGYPSTQPGSPTDQATAITISNNTLLNCARSGIFLYTAVWDCKIESNLIINPGSQFLADGVTTPSTSDNLNCVGITADNISTHKNLDVNNNTVIETRSSVYANFSVSVSTTITGIRAAGNRGINTRDVNVGGNATESFDTFYAAKNFNGLTTHTAGVRVGSSAGTTNLFARIDGAAGNARRFVLGTGSSSDRWAWTANGTAEGGSNAGSDLELRAYSDAGSLLSTPLTVTRSSGNMTLGDGVTLAVGTTTGTKIGTSTSQKIGFYNSTPVVKPTVTGAKGSNAALGSLMTALASLGLVIDSTTT